FSRRLDQLDPVPLAGTQNARNPFFSPDGRWVAYFSGSRLYKLPLAGGPAAVVADVPGVAFGATWGTTDTIVFRLERALMKVAAAGGKPQLLLQSDTSRGESYMFPHYLPDAKALLLQIRTKGVDRLGVLTLATGKLTRFEQPGSNPRYVSSGHVVVATRSGTLLAMPAGPQAYIAPRVSPDGRQIAVEVAELALVNSDVWVYDRAQHTRTRLTFDQSAHRPIWTPDGRRIVYSRGQFGQGDLYWIPADGSGPAELLLVAPEDQWAGDVTPDGRTLLFRSGGGGPVRSIYTLSLQGPRTAQPFLANQFDKHTTSLSPGGHWVAYVSNELGRPEVYVRPFPGPGGRWQVSLDGGTEPLWAA